MAALNVKNNRAFQKTATLETGLAPVGQGETLDRAVTKVAAEAVAAVEECRARAALELESPFAVA